MSDNLENSVHSTPSTENQPPDAPPVQPVPIAPSPVSESFREFPVSNVPIPPNSLSDQQLRVIDLLITGTTLTEAATAVGVTVRTIYNWRHRDATFASEYDARWQMVWDQSLREMRDLIAPAVRVFAEQLRHRHEYPRYRAANAILRIAGVKKASPHRKKTSPDAHHHQPHRL